MPGKKFIRLMMIMGSLAFTLPTVNAAPERKMGSVDSSEKLTNELNLAIKMSGGTELPKKVIYQVLAKSVKTYDPENKEECFRNIITDLAKESENYGHKLKLNENVANAVLSEYYDKIYFVVNNEDNSNQTSKKDVQQSSATPQRTVSSGLSGGASPFRTPSARSVKKVHRGGTGRTVVTKVTTTKKCNGKCTTGVQRLVVTKGSNSK